VDRLDDGDRERILSVDRHGMPRDAPQAPSGD
jgi:hypothetical protein